MLVLYFGHSSRWSHQLCALQFAKIIQQCEFPVKFEVSLMIQHLHFDPFVALAVQLTTICVFQEFKLQNIVGSCDVKFPIRLEGLAYSHGIFSSVCFQHTQQTDSPPCAAFPTILMLSMM